MNYKIKSSDQAQRRSDRLKSIWSNESYLTLQVLIYVARLLERLLRKPASIKHFSIFGARSKKTENTDKYACM